MRTSLAVSTALCCLALCCLALCSPVSAQAPPPAGDDVGPASELREEYRRVVAQGVAEFAAGHWAEARAAFLSGHELWPSARTLRSLGMTSFELRAYARAATELQAALDDVRRPLSEEQRTHVTTLLRQTRAFVGHYRVRLSPADAHLLVDGAPQSPAAPLALVLEVGRHELVARAAGHEVLRRTLDVQGREDEELLLALQPAQQPATTGPAAAATSSAAPLPLSPAASSAMPSRPTPRADDDANGRGRLWTWVAGGAALALGAASTALWLHSRAEYDAIDTKCARVQCVRGELDESPFTTPETAHHVTLAFALAAGAGAVLLFVLEGEPGETDARPASTGMTLAPAGLGVRAAW